MRTRILACGTVLGLLTLVGCAGHGKHVQEGMKQAQERVNGMKAKNEYDQAWQSYLAGDMDKAEKSLDRSIGLAPSVPKSFVLKGRILLEKGDLERALLCFQKAEALEPKFVEAPYYQGIVFERFSQPDKALEKYQRAATLEPANPQYAVATAETMCDLNQLDEAEKYLTDRAASFEHNAGVRQTLGHIAMLRGENEKAVTMFNEARLLAPDDNGIVEDLVHAQISTGRFADAEFNLARLQKIPANKDRRDLRQMRARCLMNLDRPLEARDVLIELTSGDAGQRDVDAWIELGNVCFLLRDMNRTRQSWQRVIAISPERHEGWMLKALYQRRTDDAAGALKTVERAIERRGDNVDPLMLKGLILRDQGREAEAQQTFAQALAQDPSNESAKKAMAGATETQN